MAVVAAVDLVDTALGNWPNYAGSKALITRQCYANRIVLAGVYTRARLL